MLLLVLVAGALGYLQLDRSSKALAARLQQLEADSAARVQAAEQQARQARDEVQKLDEEIERLRGQRTELDQLYQDLTRGRDDAALVEIERLITLAAQELQVTGNVATAVAALQAADARLARMDRPQLVNLRRAVTRDLERLRSAPAADITGLALKLDQIIATVDGWALLADPAPRAAAPAPAKTDAKALAPTTTPAHPPTFWEKTRAWLHDEFGDLVRVREVDTPEALLLTEAQQRLVRQQMRLRLLGARHALLTRNDKLFRADLAEAQALLTRYFDARQPAVSTAGNALRGMAQTPLSVEVPQIAETVAAVRAVRQGR